MREPETVSGVQSRSDSPGKFDDDDLISLILTLPRKVTGNERVQVRCDARVRSRRIQENQTVVVAEIEDYEFLSSLLSKGITASAECFCDK